jgi:hypothetical protein
MERRQFIATSVAASAAALAGARSARAESPAKREFYQLRRYNLMSTQQLQLTENYLADAFIPALGRLGLGPVGAFKLDIGQDTPTYYVLVPGPSPDELATIDWRLGKDEAFLKTAAPFWNATSAAPAFQRVEISLMAAFVGWPKLTPPAAKTKRIFQLRTYESPSNFDHVRKVEMFHSGEFDIFLKAGFRPVFFGDTLFGSHLPNLTYMLSFANMAELEAQWGVFHDDPNWKKLSGDPKFAFDHIVTNISNIILSPLACSQI